MKKRLQYLISIVLISPLLVIVPAVVAHGEETHTSDSSATSASESKESKTLSEAEMAELKARLEKQKTAFKLKLAAAENAAIKAKCTPAQSSIKSLSTRFLTNVPKRIKAYENLSSHINTLLGKLQAKGADTTELQQDLTVLQAKITTYKTDLATYTQALSDAKNVDCATDPTAFKAALQTARTARDKVMADIADIKAYVTDTIKPELKKIRTTLETQEKSNSESEGSN